MQIFAISQFRFLKEMVFGTYQMLSKLIVHENVAFYLTQFRITELVTIAVITNTYC